MTLSQMPDTRSVVPGQSSGPDPQTRPKLRSTGTGRERSIEDEEAYRRSVMEQAKIDIAAGW